MGTKKLITLLIPAFNEEQSIKPLYESLVSHLGSLETHYDFEILFVNDGSEDRTLDILKQYREKDARISFIDLSRNFGKEIAMMAGMDYAKGDAIIIMDADLQHPPEVIPELIKHWEEGYEDVYATRVKREGESWLRRFTSKKYYELLQKTTRMPICPDAGDFRLLDRRCIEAVKKMRESHRYTKGLYCWIGFKKKEIKYVAAPRVSGESKWSYISLLNLAVEGLTSYTTLPLRLSSFFGFLVSFLALVYMVITIIKTLVMGIPGTGYTTLLVCILLLGGIQLISIGIIGEYLGRIFIETKQRPLYYVEEYNGEQVMP
ncbi:glycosyltransferase family 2 protein [Pullulanibacillus sp. KACC 23026]|uniref:glycosyltransferase family 2 protein n=1 Tax=Pullulanibacillus sp. KACC 23026 TaxID=3028315 RepID=UPI0023AE969E|nr:glycosyltransferase family 2 protein [Pullulanibacillus sp. KACC 23026]WEG12195.1 glycosyltransferase family 2 protein [Pullulanibacillus sp. KACC 23026]